VIVVDASVWVSRFVLSDAHHTVSREWLGRRAEHEELVVAPGILLAEVAGAVARRSGRARLGHRAVTDLLSWGPLRLVPLDALLAETAAYLAADLVLRGADAAYVAVAQRLGVPLVTWDREQRERAGVLVHTYEPSTASA